jgi:lipopolysaccharide export system permease protein
VFGSILHRMILWELVKVFVMALLGITGILLMAGIVAEASQEGLSPTQIVAAIPLLIPSTLPYTIPATTLFACCVVYGRLAADNEILAIKSSGVNILHVVRPGLLLGVAACAVTMTLYWNVIPLSHRLLRQMVYDDAEELLYSTLRKQHSLNYAQMPYAIWVKGVDGRKLRDPVIKGRSPQGATNFVAQAKEAELRVDMVRRKLTIRMRYGAAMTPEGDNVKFDAKEVEVDLPPTFGSDGARSARDMTWSELLDKRKEFQLREEYCKKCLADLQPAGAPPAPANLALDAPSNQVQLKMEEDFVRKQILYIDVEMLMRPALSFGCFCFVLIGCPVGIWFSRSDYLSAFITCFLPIVFLYYPILLCGINLAKSGRIVPAASIWAADALMALIALGLFRRLLRN